MKIAVRGGHNFQATGCEYKRGKKLWNKYRWKS